MFEILIISAILAYATLGIGHALSKMGSHSCSVSNSTYSPNGEDYNEKIHLLSHNNSASEITRKDGLFYITIENSITGDKQTLSHRNKKYLCWDVHPVQSAHNVRERDEFHKEDLNTD